MTMPKLSWEKDAERALKKVPFFVRPLVRRKVEERVMKANCERVTLLDFQAAAARFQSVMAGRPESELRHMMPAPNQPGVEMVIVEACHNKLSNCPNPLIDTEVWKQAVEDWARKNNISEKLRGRVKGDTIYHYHKFHVSISGCPNACSRPQIAEAGMTGFAKPEVDAEKCDDCGICAEVCPDRAITVNHNPPVFDLNKCLGCLKCRDICPEGCIQLAEPGVRAMMGGKLGRRPHLAEVIAEAQTPDDSIAILDQAVKDYLANGRAEERFSEYWIRTNRA
jgi:dissimilatory sulfite reductase (desulfoviridin) alpha/beta subunit